MSKELCVLVTPAGMSPGVVYSALHACPTRPGLVLPVCSPQTEERTVEFCRGAKVPVRPLVLRDPIGGVDEVSRLVLTAREYLVLAHEVFANLTGGTTLMGLVALEISQMAEEMGLATRRFGLIDRRPREEQLANPYVAGEAYWID